MSTHVDSETTLEVWVKLNNGKEKLFKLKNERAAVRPGHQVAIITGYPVEGYKGANAQTVADGTPLAFKNLSTGETLSETSFYKGVAAELGVDAGVAKTTYLWLGAWVLSALLVSALDALPFFGGVVFTLAAIFFGALSLFIPLRLRVFPRTKVLVQELETGALRLLA